MSDIAIGQQLVEWPAAVFDQDGGQTSNISSGTPTVGSPTVEVTFTSPPTGRVILVVGGGIRQTGSSRLIVFPQVYEGASAAGTLIAGITQVDRHGWGGGADVSRYAHWSRRSLLQGLTPNVTHYARLMYYVTGGSGSDIRARELAVIPAT